MIHTNKLMRSWTTWSSITGQWSGSGRRMWTSCLNDTACCSWFLIRPTLSELTSQVSSSVTHRLSASYLSALFSLSQLFSYKNTTTTLYKHRRPLQGATLCLWVLSAVVFQSRKCQVFLKLSKQQWQSSALLRKDLKLIPNRKVSAILWLVVWSLETCTSGTHHAINSCWRDLTCVLSLINQWLWWVIPAVASQHLHPCCSDSTMSLREASSLMESILETTIWRITGTRSRLSNKSHYSSMRQLNLILSLVTCLPRISALLRLLFKLMLLLSSCKMMRIMDPRPSLTKLLASSRS